MSERFEVYYVRKKSGKTELDSLEKKEIDLILNAPADKFILLKYINDSPDISRNSCQYYSKIIGESIYIGIQENVNSFHYEHWKEGKLLRLLSYNSDYQWHTVSGVPEEWEKNVLFRDDKLELILKCYEENFHEEIRKAWEMKNIKQGDQFPSIIEIEAYNGLLNYLSNFK
ncbi:MAG: hypothetical protein HQK79_22135 [Desulfobacterales bacterium]|nr:hypothetical protein [Desulfobacterales bacterium]MBF0397559.1 hypothetical protein [Desulfobacterales bacterium]